jgi:sulfate permease, SulP family
MLVKQRAQPAGVTTAGLARDAIAGLTVGVVLIPQSLAYAGVAGMPPATGLHAAALAPIVAALFASSPYLQTGPVAITSLLTFGALSSQDAVTGTPHYVALAVALALIVGVTRIAIGLLRAGVVARLMSEPVLAGFTPAAGLLIVATQIPALLGMGAHGDVLDAALDAIEQPDRWDAAAIALAGATLAVLAASRRLHPLVPGALLALAIGLALGHGGASVGPVVGDIPSGLPGAPDIEWDAIPSLVVPGIVIALVGFAETAAVCRTYATRERHAWDHDREFVSQGAANVAAAVAGGFPVGGSLSRSALNHAAGARTRASGAIAGLCVLAFLPFAGTLEPLPRAVLAAIVIAAVLSLVDLRRLARLWRLSRPQFLVAAITFGLTLALSPHVERAILAGVGLAILVHLWRELRVDIQSSAEGDTVELRPQGVLWYGSADELVERLADLLSTHRDARRLRLRLDGLGRIDLSGALALERLVEDARAAGLTVEVTGAPPQAKGLLERLTEHGAP